MKGYFANELMGLGAGIYVKELFAFAWLVYGAVSGLVERSRFIGLGAGFFLKNSLLLHDWCGLLYWATCWVFLTELFSFAWLVQGAVRGPAERSRSIGVGAGIFMNEVFTFPWLVHEVYLGDCPSSFLYAL